MFRPSEIIINAFIDNLCAEYETLFGEHKTHLTTLRHYSRALLSQYALSDALFHNLDHNIVVTDVAKDIIRGKILKECSVTPEQWLNYIIAVMGTNIGMIRNLFPEDSDNRISIDNETYCVQLAPGSTDAALWPHAYQRSKRHLRNILASSSVLSADEICDMLSIACFPIDETPSSQIPAYQDLLRAAHIIGTVADPNFSLKMTRFLLEIREAKLNDTIKSGKVDEIRSAYPLYFWRVIQPLIDGACAYLQFSSDGLEWLANMHSHLLIDEHQL